MGHHRADGPMKGISQQLGGAFEDLFVRSCMREQVNCTRIPNGCKILRPGKIVPVRTPFDFIINRGKFAAVVDCKTVQEGTFQRSMATTHQIESMLPIAVSLPAGYCIHFRDSDQVAFFSVFRINKLKAGESLSPEDGLYLGAAGNMNPGMILEWVDDGKSEAPLFQQRLF